MIVRGRLGFGIVEKGLRLESRWLRPLRPHQAWPSILRVDFGMTAMGFIRRGSMNVYSHPERSQDDLDRSSGARVRARAFRTPRGVRSVCVPRQPPTAEELDR